VTLSVDGPAVLLGDNPFPLGDVGGVGAVWLRTLRDTPGTVTVTATHPALGRASATVRVRQAVPGGAPAPYGTLSASTASPLAVPGTTVGLTATFTNNGAPELQSVALGLDLPPGWSAQAGTPSSFAGLASGQTVQASWQLAVPADAAPATVQVAVDATYTAHGERARSSMALTLSVPYTSLSKAYDNTGISDDSNVDSAAFDGVGDSYSAQALAAAGLQPGTRVERDGVAVVWPDVPAGTPDNVVADGQTVLLSGLGSKLAFLGASNGGNLGGTGTVLYTDGTTSRFSVTLDDFWYLPTAGDVVASTPYVNSQGIGGRPRGKRQQTVYVIAMTVDITPGKQVLAVTLPSGGTATPPGSVKGMHVFAIGIGG
jgi:beta-galactosidase